MKTVYNLIIVDESGSMCLIEQQAFAGMNETIQTVKQLQKKYPEIEQRITLMTFETGKIVEEEYSGGFTGYSYSSTISDPCV